MRTRAIAATVIAASGLLLAGCGSLGSTVTTTANNTPTGSTSTTQAAVKPAAVGDSITISGFNSEKITVALVKTFPNAQGSDQFNTPDAGKEFYAVQLRITNDASKASPLAGRWSTEASEAAARFSGSSGMAAAKRRVRLPWASMSTHSTLWPASAAAAAVPWSSNVFPSPPLWLAKQMCGGAAVISIGLLGV